MTTPHTFAPCPGGDICTECGNGHVHSSHGELIVVPGGLASLEDRIAGAVRDAIATEREACARLCDDAAAGSRGIHRLITDARVAAEVTGKIHRAETLAKRIRARGTQ